MPFGSDRIERKERDFNEHYRKLSPDQLETVYSLTKIGYVLHFVRVEQLSKQRLAVLKQGEKFASVNHVGDIDYEPKINIR